MSRSFKPHLAYSASAGSGKTFALSVRYISLLFLGVEPSTILAATFTNKAASEMKHRVVNSLINLKDNRIFLDAISKETDMSPDEVLAKQPQVLELFLSSSNFIVTLDSFFTSILRSASLYIDIEPDFVTKEIDPEHKEEVFLDEIEANSLLYSLVKLVMDIEDKRFLKLFELMQNFYKIEPLLPKKKYTIKNLSILEDNIDRQRELLFNLVTTAKASKTAIKNFEPIEVKMLFKKSIFSKSSLYEHRNYKRYVEKNPNIEYEYLKLKEMLRDWANRKEQIVLHNLFKLFDYYKNANISTAKQLGVLSFDDLSFFTYRLLYQSINKDFLYFKIDSRFRHILLDEFQDTATIQFLLLKPLIDEIFDGVGQSEFRSFFYVGDTKQSLYRFRGGVEELFNAVADSYGIEIAQMDTNYRSSKSVVEQVNRWFDNRMQGYFPQKTYSNANEGFVEVIESEELVAEAIKKLEWLLQKGVDISDIAFLVSTNKDGVAIQEACYLKGIDTRLKTSSSLKHIPKVATVVAMVDYLFNKIPLDAMGVLESIKKEFKDINTEWFNPFMQPLLVVDRIIADFGYFENDLNLLKLLEFASNFSDIATFLEEFRLSKIEVSSNSKHGAMIMTIHGSKGLEFEHVILVDRLKGNVPERMALLYEYNKSLDIKRVCYKIGGRENFDSEYKGLLERQKVLSSKDKMNILYVALTRAVESMIIIRKPKGSIFDIIGMTPMSVGTLKVKRAKNIEGEQIREDITLTSYGVQEINIVEDDEKRDYKAMLFGTALHYTLEMLSDFKIENLNRALIATKNRYGLELTEDELKDIKNRVTNLISYDKFQELLTDATITKEQSLCFNGEFKQIDLLLEYKSSYLIIDYKSSKKYHSKHCIQVKYYQEAIEDITKKPTKGVILYILDDTIELFDIL
jgi:exodeoxyribonuclease V beta subunit